MMKRTLAPLAALVALLATGCQGGEPQGDIPAPGVKVAKPGDPGPQPTNPTPNPGAAPSPAPVKAGGGQNLTQ